MAQQTPPRVPLITVFGSLNADLTFYVPHAPAAGETLTSTRYVVRPGGKGANQAVAAARLSRDGPDGPANGHGAGGHPGEDAAVRMVGAVGADSHGDMLLEALRRSEINVDGVSRREGQKTGLAVITVDETDGENRIVLAPEANHSMATADEDVIARVLDPRPDMLVLQLEIPLDVVVKTIRRAKAAGVQVLLNPAPALPLPEDVYRDLDHLIVNETEATLLSGIDVMSSARAIGDAADRFEEWGVKNVVITAGSRGAFCNGLVADGHRVKQWIRSKAVEHVVDTTGAGDTFVGAYALAFTRRERFFGEVRDIVDACAQAAVAAASSVTRPGAMESIPWRDQLVRETA